MPIYSEADSELKNCRDRMMEKYHGPLRDAGVTTDLVFAEPRSDGEGVIAPEACALKLHGYPVQAMVKINSYKLRFKGHADAEILVDKQRWQELKDEEKDALIDHELEHLELKTDRDGLLVRDDLDRPKLRMRLHDWEHGWFDSIARRHGPQSQEVQQFEKFKAAHRQTWIDFKDDEPESVPIHGSGISSVKFSSPGHEDVTLTGDVGKKLKQAAKSIRKTGGRRAASKR